MTPARSEPAPKALAELVETAPKALAELVETASAHVRAMALMPGDAAVDNIVARLARPAKRKRPLSPAP